MDKSIKSKLASVLVILTVVIIGLQYNRIKENLETGNNNVFLFILSVLGILAVVLFFLYKILPTREGSGLSTGDGIQSSELGRNRQLYKSAVNDLFDKGSPDNSTFDEMNSLMKKFKLQHQDVMDIHKNMVDKFFKKHSVDESSDTFGNLKSQMEKIGMGDFFEKMGLSDIMKNFDAQDGDGKDVDYSYDDGKVKVNVKSFKKGNVTHKEVSTSYGEGASFDDDNDDEDKDEDI